jgi:hypothetical protein
MDAALSKCNNWPTYTQAAGSITLEESVRIKPVWPEPKKERHIFGISEEERHPPKDPYTEEYLEDPALTY